jgi:hypothetical protein
VSFSIEIREATQHDIDRCENPGHASIDEAAAVLIDGDLVAVTNEYGTALLVPGSNATPTRDAVEAFLLAALDFREAAA